MLIGCSTHDQKYAGRAQPKGIIALGQAEPINEVSQMGQAELNVIQPLVRA